MHRYETKEWEIPAFPVSNKTVLVCAYENTHPIQNKALLVTEYK